LKTWSYRTRSLRSSRKKCSCNRT